MTEGTHTYAEIFMVKAKKWVIADDLDDYLAIVEQVTAVRRGLA